MGYIGFIVVVVIMLVLMENGGRSAKEDSGWEPLDMPEQSSQPPTGDE